MSEVFAELQKCCAALAGAFFKKSQDLACDQIDVFLHRRFPVQQHLVFKFWNVVAWALYLRGEKQTMQETTAKTLGLTWRMKIEMFVIRHSQLWSHNQFRANVSTKRFCNCLQGMSCHAFSSALLDRDVFQMLT